jgi:isoquinoline 1-oxidoreductase subunit beta
MSKRDLTTPSAVLEREEPLERVDYGFAITRRGFVQTLGAGLLITVLPAPALGQRRGERGEARPERVSARVHIDKDGAITVMTGKVEGGQGARTELTQAAAEELRVPAERITLVMADTALVPDDGITAGIRSTPSTVPAVRKGCAAARQFLVAQAAERWGMERDTLEVCDGKVVQAGSERELTYAALATGEELAKAFEQMVPADVAVTPVKEWKVLGTSVPRPNRRGLVTGVHRYPSDTVRPGMLHGKVLRPPSYGAKLTSVDLVAAKAMADVVAMQDGEFVGVAAPTTFAAEQALAAIVKTAVWEPASHPSSKDIFPYLKEHTKERVPKNPFADALAEAAKVLRQTYYVAYVQHAPLEPRAAVAEWEGDKLTVWAGTQNPFGYQSELARTLHVDSAQVRVIVPDFGAGFGGKHTAEAAVEAARLAREAKRPVALRWTRVEEFTWAYFRPAAVIEIEAGLDAGGSLTSWYFVNINSGPAGIETPYGAGKAKSQYVPADAPLRQGSYRALAATANNFARECCMDELAEAAERDPLNFRLAHLEGNPRLRAVLEAAAMQFGWEERFQKKDPNVGVGLACGTEKGSCVAACVEVGIDREKGGLTVRRVCQVFECGAVLNPDNLVSQIRGCIIMGLGPALREEMQFEGGKMLNASFWRYPVPRFKDVPELDIHVLDRPDLPSAGAGETPIIVIAPAIANAVFHATGTRIREMPVRLPKA